MFKYIHKYIKTKPEEEQAWAWGGETLLPKNLSRKFIRMCSLIFLPFHFHFLTHVKNHSLRFSAPPPHCVSSVIYEFKCQVLPIYSVSHYWKLEANIDQHVPIKICLLIISSSVIAGHLINNPMCIFFFFSFHNNQQITFGLTFESAWNP